MVPSKVSSTVLAFASVPSVLELGFSVEDWSPLSGTCSSSHEVDVSSVDVAVVFSPISLFLALPTVLLSFLGLLLPPGKSSSLEDPS